jgi:hypothetical protein
MHRRMILAGTVAALWVWNTASAIEKSQANLFGGQDLHLTAQHLQEYQPSPERHVLIFKGDFSMSIGANQFSSNSAVIWLQRNTSNYQGRVSSDYYAQAYLEGNVNVSKGKTAATTNINSDIMHGQQMVTRFTVSGDVFVTAQDRTNIDPNTSPVYQLALNALAKIHYEPFKERQIAEANEVPEPNAPAPKPQGEIGFNEPYKREYMYPAAKPPTLDEALGRVDEPNKPRKPWLIEEFFMPAGKPLPGVIAPGVSAGAKGAAPAAPQVKYQYPVNVMPVDQKTTRIQSRVETPDGMMAATITGRVYVWQRKDEQGDTVELQADNAVVFYRQNALSLGKEETGQENLIASGAIRSIYLSGAVVLTEGNRTIRSNEIYYDFEKRTALAINAEMRTFDEHRNIPIYVRAAKLRMLSPIKFAADKTVLTTSEFYLPDLSLSSSTAIITDVTHIDELAEQYGDKAYDADLRDVRLNFGETCFFKWDRMETTLSRSDIPIKSLDVGYDNTYGFGVESKWYLSRLLGLRQPEGTDTTLRVDGYSKRGVGVGVNVDYKREEYFGHIRSYIIQDNGSDNLGSIDQRQDVTPESTLRGRFTWQHRQFLGDGWTLTAETSYISDRNFLEEFERTEFNTGKEPETVLYLKKIQDNWGLSFLVKPRINDWQTQLEELPTVEYHRTGESLLDDKLTFYSDSQFSEFSQKIGSGLPLNIPEQSYTFGTSRNEVDLPLTVDTWKFVPYVAGTGGYDDRSGFSRSIVTGQGGEPGPDSVGFGEIGTRASGQYWAVYPEAESRLFDVHEIRHIMKPYFVGAAYETSDDEIQQRNTADIGLLQRWQTKRGEGANQHEIDWMRWDNSFVLVQDPAPVTPGSPAPSRFIWNQPAVPLEVYSAPGIFNDDLSTINQSLTHFEVWGPTRNTYQSDYVWRATDTLAVLSDLNYDLDSEELEQFDIGYSHLVYPHLSYYLGTRYLNRVQVLNDVGSNVITAAITYIIDPRYTITLATQYDTENNGSLTNEITIMRQYRRIYYGFTFSADASLDRQSVMLSIWPEGIPELASGSQRYAHLATPTAPE